MDSEEEEKFYFYADKYVRIPLSEIPKDTKILRAIPGFNTITDFRLLGHLKN